MRSILCFGDSNTWGYDPRSILEDRYDPDSRWCDLLAEKLRCPVLNQGSNGRCIPGSAWEYRALDRLLESAGPLSLMVLMLGTNDILMGRGPESVTDRMEALLRHLLPAGTPILLLSPPAIRLPEPELRQAADTVAGSYQALAQRLGLSFLDTRMLPTGSDGIHLSQSGHRQLSELLASLIKLDHLL